MVLPAPSVFFLGDEVKEIFHLSPFPGEKGFYSLLAFCAKVPKARWLIAAMIRGPSRDPKSSPEHG